MNIHFIAGQKIKTPRGHKPSKEGTEAARLREGKTCPGGKVLRRHRSRLEARQTAFNGMSSLTQESMTLPGSLK